MLGVRPAVFVQDENAGPMGPMLKVGHENKDSARAPLQPLAKDGVAPGGLRIRRALGNITNTPAAVGKPPAQGSSGDKGSLPSKDKRKALGDITNAFNATTTSSNAIKKAPSIATAPVAAAKPQLSARDLQAQKYAQEGVERLAGKSWTQLESERQQSIMKGINRRVQAFANVLGSASCWRPLDENEDAGPRVLSDDDDVPALPLVPPTSTIPAQTELLTDDDCLLLPDTNMADSLPAFSPSSDWELL